MYTVKTVITMHISENMRIYAVIRFCSMLMNEIPMNRVVYPSSM